MKAKKEFQFNENQKDYLIRLKKRRFPWWIFLFLILLLLLIKVNRKVEFRVIDKQDKSVISNADIYLSYLNPVDDKEVTKNDVSDEDGERYFVIERVMIWQLLFKKYNSDADVDVTHTGYLPFESTNELKTLIKEINIVELEKYLAEFKIITIDSITRERIAEVEIELIQSDYEQIKNTDNVGESVFDDIPAGDYSDIIVYARHEAYEDVRKKITIPDKILPENDTVVMLAIDEGGMRGERGEININLKWDTRDDLDLFMVTPCFDTIYFDKPAAKCRNFEGKLDIDANAEDWNVINDPQENIFWKNAPAGQYQVYVLFYKHRQHYRVPYTVTVMIGDEKKIFTGETTKVMEFQPIYNFEY